MPGSAALTGENLDKSYGGAAALRGVSFSIEPGEIHGLCGENGAGKSTLIKILGGAVRADSGRVLIGGAEVSGGVVGAEAAGVSVIHQEPISFPDLSAEDTVFVGREPTRLGGLWLDRGLMRRRTAELLLSLGERIDTRRPVGELPLAQRQMVAVARAISGSCKFLILDEPTASLSAREAEVLHSLMRRLAASGVGIVLVSHRLEEVLSLTGRVTVLRDGALVGCESTSGLTRSRLVNLMVGREVVERGRSESASGEVRVSVKGLARQGVFGPVSFDLRAGEIVGFAGLVGAGRSEVARALIGIDGRDAGEVLIDGKEMGAGDWRAAAAAGVMLAPEDRRLEGLVLPMSVGVNATFGVLPRLSKFGVIDRRRDRELAKELIGTLGVKAAGPEISAGALSGGNQQKVLLAKVMAARPKVLILDEPTRGVDVGAKAEIHDFVRGLASAGTAVMLVSSDLPEVLSLSTRVIVMREGMIGGELAGDGLTAERVLELAMPAGLRAGAA